MSFFTTYNTQQRAQFAQLLAHQDWQALAKAWLSIYDNGWQRIQKHGDFARWTKALDALPDVPATVLYGDTVRVRADAAAQVDSDAVRQALQGLCPWRKGPFEVFGVHIDTEWRSDWKWQRVLPHVSSLKGKTVLDIGCGSGYHMWRMLEAGADTVLGVDTGSLFPFHFASIKRYAPEARCFFVPASIDVVPDSPQFDTVFSMGILYHRKNPITHLYQIKSLLKPGGELVLETLIVDGDATNCLVPSGRYAQMRNVWFIPSVAMLEIWLSRVGFTDIRCVDVNITSTDEQRVTDWMQFESLANFLHPEDKRKTIEGYPAPKRATLLAKLA